MAIWSTSSTTVCKCCSIIRIPTADQKPPELAAEKWVPKLSHETLLTHFDLTVAIVILSSHPNKASIFRLSLSLTISESPCLFLLIMKSACKDHLLQRFSSLILDCPTFPTEAKEKLTFGKELKREIKKKKIWENFQFSGKCLVVGQTNKRTKSSTRFSDSWLQKKKKKKNTTSN